jgi:hypothetical protein
MNGNRFPSLLALARNGLVALLLATGGGAVAAPSGASGTPTPTALTVYKTATCGCCGEWVKHMRDAGFSVRTVDLEYPQLEARRRQLGVPDAHASCHTATVGDYLIEGHVPAASVRRLLAEKPAIVGLSVPGMVADSPGMGEHRTGTLKVYRIEPGQAQPKAYTLD